MEDEYFGEERWKKKKVYGLQQWRYTGDLTIFHSSLSTTQDYIYWAQHFYFFYYTFLPGISVFNGKRMKNTNA